MLDRYWFGDVERISPEAPVPVVKIARNEERPGGAANVARNAAALGAQVTLISVIGDDEAGRLLEKLLAGEGVRTSFHRDPAVPTTVKLRVIGRQQQLLRIDFETAPSHEILATKLADYERALPEFDAVVLSDYGKGGLAHIERMIERAKARGTPVLVDPKGEDYQRYRGATLLTPNRTEFREVAGRWRTEAELAAKAQKLRAELAPRGAADHALRGRHVALHRCGRGQYPRACARGLRCFRRRRHGHRHAGRAARRAGRSGRPRCASPTQPPASSSASSVPPSCTRTSLP